MQFQMCKGCIQKRFRRPWTTLTVMGGTRDACNRCCRFMSGGTVTVEAEVDKTVKGNGSYIVHYNIRPETLRVVA